MGLTDRVRTLLRPARGVTYDWQGYGDFLNFGGNQYPLFGNQTLTGEREEINGDFTGLATGAYQRNGIIFSLMRDRLAIFSQARFQYQRIQKGRPGDLWGDASLGILEKPWYGGTTADFLAKASTHVDMAGNFFAVKRRNQIKVMRPDWVSRVFGSFNDVDVDADDLDSELLGYIYYPGGRYSGEDPVLLDRDLVADYAPYPDPLSPGRGMSWLTPVIREMAADSAATAHKLKFFENGATPNMIVKRSDTIGRTPFKEWVELMEQGHAGLANAYKTLYLSEGADATVVGKDLQQIDFKVVQGAGETRLAAAAGIHPVIAGLSEGMAGSSLNAGNFNSARRLVADKTMWHLWSNIAGSLETIVPAPSGSRLWVDGRDIPFLREDRKDAAEIQQVKAASIRTLTDAGFEPVSVVAAVEGENMSLLSHSGLYSVQLQPPMPETPDPEPEPVEPDDAPDAETPIEETPA
jgi:phage portal protein BeeE